jgi:polyphosphate kinase
MDAEDVGGSSEREAKQGVRPTSVPAESGQPSLPNAEDGQSDLKGPGKKGGLEPEKSKRAEKVEDSEKKEASEKRRAGKASNTPGVIELVPDIALAPTLTDLARDIPWATTARDVAPGASLRNPSLLFNRELSSLDFNWRVLYQALDPGIPLAERVFFLSITASNLDEFVMKRVGGLRRQHAAGVTTPSADGRSPYEQLKLIRPAVAAMQERMSATWRELEGRLRDQGVLLHDYDDLTAFQRHLVSKRFRSSIYPILTPLAIESGDRFPNIANLGLRLALVLRHPERGTRHVASVNVPTGSERWIPLDEAGHFVAIEQVIANHVDELFRGMEIEASCLFRITRNADMRRDEEEADDLLKMISDELRERRFAPVVRLEIERGAPAAIRDLLERELSLLPEDVFEVDGLFILSDLTGLTSGLGPKHRFKAWQPVLPPELYPGDSNAPGDIFSVLRATDVLVHHPYDSFTGSVQRFIEEAAWDPGVRAIKLTLYRTSATSPIIRALIRAADNGVEVAALVEVTARFDEEDNIEWGQLLGRSGVHVTFGVAGLKTHAKVALVLREEPEGIRAYSHVGTGNYHSETARQYADLGVLTSRSDVGRDLVNLFHYLTGYAPQQEYENLIVSPHATRPRLYELIQGEVDRQKAGEKGRIVAKMNGLDDSEMIRALYRASREGVRIDLIVRGLCCLRPGVEGVSDNIRVRSIVGRFLEHDRIYWFRNGGDPIVYTGSADWRRRNLDNRVEALIRIDDPKIKKNLWRILKFALADRRLAWELGSDGQWRLTHWRGEKKARNYHKRLMKRARKQRKKARSPWDLKPRRETPPPLDIGPRS